MLFKSVIFCNIMWLYYVTSGVRGIVVVDQLIDHLIDSVDSVASPAHGGVRGAKETRRSCASDAGE